MLNNDDDDDRRLQRALQNAHAQRFGCCVVFAVHDCAVGWKMIAHAQQILDNHQSVSMRVSVPYTRTGLIHTHTTHTHIQTNTLVRMQTYWRGSCGLSGGDGGGGGAGGTQSHSLANRVRMFCTLNG